MTLDELTDRLGHKLRDAKEQLVATTPHGDHDLEPGTDLNPQLVFFRGGEPVASVQVGTTNAQHYFQALVIGAAGFEADVSAAVFDTYTFLDEAGEPQMTRDGLPEVGEALQIYSANRAGDVRWVQHSYVIHGRTVEWLGITHPGGQVPRSELINQLKGQMDGPSMMQVIHGPDGPAWLKEAAALAAATGEVENRWFLDLGTAMTLRAVAPGQFQVTLYGRRGGRRHQVMEKFPPISFPTLS